jgi:hypothetical protein
MRINPQMIEIRAAMGGSHADKERRMVPTLAASTRCLVGSLMEVILDFQLQFLFQGFNFFWPFIARATSTRYCSFHRNHATTFPAYTGKLDKTRAAFASVNTLQVYRLKRLLHCSAPHEQFHEWRQPEGQRTLLLLPDR